jgi:hypothetical protein
MIHFFLRLMLLGFFCFVAAPAASAFQVQRPLVARSASSSPTTRILLTAPHFPEKNSSNSNSSSSKSTAPPKDASLFKLIDDAGQGLKPAAVQANAKASLAETKRHKYLYMVKSCLLYTAFILYRAYRGLFVILPAVFRETSRKLQAAVDEAPFDDTQAVEEAEAQQPMKLRTRITVSVLAAIVTASYVLGGAIRVATTLIRNATKGGLTQSFAAAASEQERNEDTILQKTVKQRKNDVNGQDQQGLTP